MTTTLKRTRSSANLVAATMIAATLKIIIETGWYSAIINTAVGGRAHLPPTPANPPELTVEQSLCKR